MTNLYYFLESLCNRLRYILLDLCEKLEELSYYFYYKAIKW
jgi:hypothetical protein